MIKSLVVSLAIILFVSVVSFEVLASTEINKCMSLFIEDNPTGSISADRRQADRIPGDQYLLSFADRIEGQAQRAGKDVNVSAQLIQKIYEAIIAINKYQGSTPINFSDKFPRARVFAKMISFYSETLVHQLQKYDSNRLDLRQLQVSLTAEMSRAPRNKEQIKELNDLMDILKSEQDEVFAEITIGLLGQRRGFYALSPKKGNKAIVEIQMPNFQNEANVEILENAYHQYALSKSWTVNTLSRVESKGKLVSVILSIEGLDALTMLAAETGQHKFKTTTFGSKEGDSHVTVLVFAPATAEHSVVEKIRTEIIVNGVHSQGAGGQSVNTTNSAADAFHPPSNIRVKVQTERSFTQNKETAIQLIISKIKEKEDQEAEIAKQLQLRLARENPLLARSRYVRTIVMSENARAAQALLSNLEPALNLNLGQIEIYELSKLIAEVSPKPKTN